MKNNIFKILKIILYIILGSWEILFKEIIEDGYTISTVKNDWKDVLYEILTWMGFIMLITIILMSIGISVSPEQDTNKPPQMTIADMIKYQETERLIEDMRRIHEERLASGYYEYMREYASYHNSFE